MYVVLLVLSYCSRMTPSANSSSVVSFVEACTYRLEVHSSALSHKAAPITNK